MPPKTDHLVERAAEQLAKAGMLDASTAQLIHAEPQRPGDQSRPHVPPLPPGADPASFHPVPTEFMRENGGALPNGLAPELGPLGNLHTPSPARPVGTALDVLVDATTLERAGVVPSQQSRGRVPEELRLVQSQILRAAFGPEAGRAGHANLLMVTSAKPGEGKTFAALNLAASIARQQDREVILLDVDSKRDSLQGLLGLTDRQGLLDLATDPRLDPERLLIRTSLPKLSVMPLGPNLERSADLFATRQMARTIKELGRRYADRLIVLDAPPCLSSSDPTTLAPTVGQAVVVVEAERTQREEVEAAVDLIETCPNIMLLLNKVRLTTNNTFGAYSYRYAN